MKKLLLLLLIVLAVTPAAFAQEGWRDRPYRGSNRGADGSLEITPFAGVQWGGTLYDEDVQIFTSDVQLETSKNLGVSVGIPLNQRGLKLELLVNRQETEVGWNGGFFGPDVHLGDFNVTYYQAGILVPFNASRSGVTPFFALGAGVTSLDPVSSGFGTENRFSVSGAIGVKVPLAQNLALRAEFRGFATSMNDDNCRRCGYYYDDYRDMYQGTANVGVSFRF